MLVEFGALYQVDEVFLMWVAPLDSCNPEMLISDRADRHFWVPTKYTFPRCVPAKLLYFGVQMHHCHWWEFSPFLARRAISFPISNNTIDARPKVTASTFRGPQTFAIPVYNRL